MILYATLKKNFVETHIFVFRRFVYEFLFRNNSLF